MYSRGCAPSRQTDTRVQIQSRALQIWLISELLFLMHPRRMEHALFGGTVACVWPALTLSLSPPPDYALLERLFERASPAHAPLEHPVRARDPRLRTARTPVRARCALVRSPAPPPAPRSISKYSLRPEPRSRVTGLTCTRTGVCPGSPGVFLPVPVYDSMFQSATAVYPTPVCRFFSFLVGE